MIENKDIKRADDQTLRAIWGLEQIREEGSLVRQLKDIPTRLLNSLIYRGMRYELEKTRLLGRHEALTAIAKGAKLPETPIASTYLSSLYIYYGGDDELDMLRKQVDRNTKLATSLADEYVSSVDYAIRKGKPIHLGDMDHEKQAFELTFALRDDEGNLTEERAEGFIQEIWELPTGEHKYLVRYRPSTKHSADYKEEILLNGRTRVTAYQSSLNAQIASVKQVKDLGDIKQSLDPEDGVEDGFGFTAIPAQPGTINDVIARVEVGRQKRDEYCKDYDAFKAEQMSDSNWGIASQGQRESSFRARFAPPLFSKDETFELDFTERIPQDKKIKIFSPIIAEIRRQIAASGAELPADDLIQRLFIINKTTYRNVLLQECDYTGQRTHYVHKPFEVVTVLPNRLVMVNFDYISGSDSKTPLDYRLAAAGTYGLWDSLAYKEIWNPAKKRTQIPEAYIKRDGMIARAEDSRLLSSSVSDPSYVYFEGSGHLQNELLTHLMGETLKTVGVTRETSTNTEKEEEDIIYKLGEIAGRDTILRALLTEPGLRELEDKLKETEWVDSKDGRKPWYVFEETGLLALANIFQHSAMNEEVMSWLR